MASIEKAFDFYEHFSNTKQIPNIDGENLLHNNMRISIKEASAVKQILSLILSLILLLTCAQVEENPATATIAEWPETQGEVGGHRSGMAGIWAA